MSYRWCNERFPNCYNALTAVKISEFIVRDLIAIPELWLGCKRHCTKRTAKTCSQMVSTGRVLRVLFFVATVCFVTLGQAFRTRLLSTSQGSAQKVRRPFTTLGIRKSYVATSTRKHNSAPGRKNNRANHDTSDSLSTENIRVIRLQRVSSRWKTRHHSSRFEAAKTPDNKVHIWEGFSEVGYRNGIVIYLH